MCDFIEILKNLWKEQTFENFDFKRYALYVWTVWFSSSGYFANRFTDFYVSRFIRLSFIEASQ